MTTILVKDTLRQSVEAASGGKQTIIYTKNGQPSFVNIIEKFDLSTIDPMMSGTHPAFIVNGIEKDVIYVGTYKGSISKGELVSQPYQAATLDYYSNLIAAARAAGKGWHVYTASERAAINALSLKASAKVLGATLEDGASQIDQTQKGKLDAVGNLKNGSGPISFRHDNSHTGISDLVGGKQEIYTGLAMFNFEIRIIENNNAASDTINLNSDSSEWKFIDGATGALMPIKLQESTDGSVRFFNERQEPYSFSFIYEEGLYQSVTDKIVKYGTTAVVSDEVINYLTKIGFIPHHGFKSIGEKYTAYPTGTMQLAVSSRSPGGAIDWGIHSLRFDGYDPAYTFSARPCFVDL